MENKLNDQPPKREINQNLVIALIGAAATILAATIPYIISLNKSQAPVPTITFIAPTEAPTFTSAPPTTEFTTTVEFTATSGGPTATATIVPTSTPIMRLDDVYLAIDPSGEVKSDTFSSDQTIYVFFKIVDPSDIRKVKVVWSRVDVPGFDPNSEVYRTEDTILKSKGSAQVGGASFGTLNPGKYKVELYLNGQLSSTLEFEIK